MIQTTKAFAPKIGAIALSGVLGLGLIGCASTSETESPAPSETTETVSDKDTQTTETPEATDEQASEDTESTSGKVLTVANIPLPEKSYYAVDSFKITSEQPDGAPIEIDRIYDLTVDGYVANVTQNSDINGEKQELTETFNVKDGALVGSKASDGYEEEYETTVTRTSDGYELTRETVVEGTVGDDDVSSFTAVYTYGDDGILKGLEETTTYGDDTKVVYAFDFDDDGYPTKQTTTYEFIEDGKSMTQTETVDYTFAENTLTIESALDGLGTNRVDFSLERDANGNIIKMTSDSGKTVIEIVYSEIDNAQASVIGYSHSVSMMPTILSLVLDMGSYTEDDLINMLGEEGYQEFLASQIGEDEQPAPEMND